MNQQKRKIIIFVLIILILGSFLFLIRKNQDFNFQEEFIFFKLFSAKPEEKAENLFSENRTTNQTYHFQVSYKNIDFKNIYLADTIKQNSLVQEKIAPRTEGDFEIVLQSNKKMNYRIQFKSSNEKPENLYFQVKGKDRKYKNLEDMEHILQGEFIENKRIMIHWKWEYEASKKENLQDTKDGQMISEYKFTIYAIGE